MFHFNSRNSVVSLCWIFALVANYQTFSQQPSTHSGYTHTHQARRQGEERHALPWSPNLTYWAAQHASRPADGQFCTQGLQVGGETVDTAGYREQCLGQQEVNISLFPLLSKLTSPSINTASIACVWDLLIAGTTTGYLYFFLLKYFSFQPSKIFKHHTP